MDDEGVEQVYLSWFGIAPPEHYGVHYRYLPGWPPFEDEALRVYHPERPLPGIYAISATNLQGVLLENPDTFAVFRDMQPIEQIGHSILIYEVPAEGTPANLALGNVRFDQIPAEVLDEYFNTNDLRLHWFSPQTSLVLMEGGAPSQICYALSSNSSFASLLTDSISLQADPIPSDADFVLYRCPDREVVAAELNSITTTSIYREASDASDSAPLSLPVRFGNVLDFLGYRLSYSPTEGGSDLILVTYWRVRECPEGDMSIFVHLVDDEDKILGQYDGLDVPSAGWYPGDVLVQNHPLSMMAGKSSDVRQVKIGLYVPETMDRVEAFDSAGVSLGSYIVLSAGESQ
jgi:hypothetical protein